MVSILWRTKHTQRSRAVRALLCHMFMMEILDTIGCIAAIVDFVWCLRSVEHSTDVAPSSRVCNQFPNEWTPKLERLLRTWIASFVISSLLTDGILVSPLSSYLLYCLVTGLPRVRRFGGLRRFIGPRNINDSSSSSFRQCYCSWFRQVRHYGINGHSALTEYKHRLRCLVGVQDPLQR